MVASIFLILFGCMVFAYAAWRLFGPGRYTLLERVLYAPVYVLARVLWRVRIEWRMSDEPPENSEPDSHEKLLADRIRGGALLVANHRCSVDPFFIQLVSGRRVHWMVAGEYFKHFLFGPLLRSYQAIPTNRGGVDTASTKRAIALAKSGRFVGMFPEGRINRSDQPLLTIRPGAAIVAMRAGVPLIPIWIEGAPRGPEVYSALFMPAKVRIFVGEPVPFTAKETTKALPSDSPSTSEAVESPEATSDRAALRAEAVAWISQVMQEAQRLGGHSKEIGIAGSQWVDQ